MSAAIKDCGLYVKVTYPGLGKAYAAKFPHWACDSRRLPVARRLHARAREAVLYRAMVLARLKNLRKAAAKADGADPERPGAGEEVS